MAATEWLTGWTYPAACGGCRVEEGACRDVDAGCHAAGTDGCGTASCPRAWRGAGSAPAYTLADMTKAPGPDTGVPSGCRSPRPACRRSACTAAPDRCR